MQVNKESLADQISQELQNRIVNVEISQGEKIDVGELEREFGVSRAPVREALQSLVDQGLVEVKPRVGYFAVELTPKQIKDICELRRLLETFALEHSINEIKKVKLERLYRESLELRDSDFSQETLRLRFDQADEEIHEMIIENSSNEFLKDFTERIHNLIALTRHLNERIEEANKEHLKLIDAILDRDLQRAKDKLKKHLDNVEVEIIHSIQSINVSKKSE